MNISPLPAAHIRSNRSLIFGLGWTSGFLLIFCRYVTSQISVKKTFIYTASLMGGGKLFKIPNRYLSLIPFFIGGAFIGIKSSFWAIEQKMKGHLNQYYKDPLNFSLDELIKKSALKNSFGEEHLGLKYIKKKIETDLSLQYTFATCPIQGEKDLCYLIVKTKNDLLIWKAAEDKIDKDPLLWKFSYCRPLPLPYSSIFSFVQNYIEKGALLNQDTASFEQRTFSLEKFNKTYTLTFRFILPVEKDKTIPVLFEKKGLSPHQVEEMVGFLSVGLSYKLTCTKKQGVTQ